MSRHHKEEMMMNTRYFTILLVCVALVAPAAWAQDRSIGEPGRGGSGPNALKNVYFGEQHLHTQNSVDAYTFATRNTPDDAFNFCKGLPLTNNITGVTQQKRTPYDWCAVTDHAEYFGVMPQLTDPNSGLSKKLKNNSIVQAIQGGTPEQSNAAFGQLAESLTFNQPMPAFNAPDIISAAWKKHVDIANKHYEPGKFTTLIAFEWTSIPVNQNLHRNVFFRDDTGPVVPFSAFDSDRPEDLWTYVETQRNSGHECFAIPHNGNLSNGLMYAPRNSYGTPIDEVYATRRARNEPATEIVQVKAASETHPALSPNDEFASFETYFVHLIGSNPGVLSRVNYGYVRRALIDGVGYQEYLGVNPYKYGIVSGADNHQAMSDNEEFAFTGAHGQLDNSPKKRIQGGRNLTGEPPYNLSSAGTTAVWAPENTREAIFDGIQGKETYGTSGTFIRLRFFGGWGYDENLDQDPNFVKNAYAGGVPMGGDLEAMPAGAKAPTFAVWALKDPESGNLDRVQIIKGWYQNGYPQEKVYDVAWSDNRKIDQNTGKLPPVGNTVNIKNATYSNSIGDTQLSAVWTDPDFDPGLHAVYYVRVLEIPTPRWSTYDAKTLGIDPPADVPATLQERAWSSPIWYTPDPKLVKKAEFYPNLHQIMN
jgi:hypothetical protein